MTPSEHKAEILRHCLWLAERDAEYAIYAAGWYEALEPWLLRNLQAKVRQAVARAAREAADASDKAGVHAGAALLPAKPRSAVPSAGVAGRRRR